MNANSNQSARSEELISSQALIKRDADSVAGTIYRYTDIAFQRGEGVYLYDFEGRRYLDFVSGIATMNVGHCHPAVVDAARVPVGAGASALAEMEVHRGLPGAT